MDDMTNTHDNETFQVKDLVGYRPVVLSNLLLLIGGRDWNHGNLMAGVWRYVITMTSQC